MRTIKFRAKSMCHEGFVYGLPIHYNRNPRTEKWTIREDSGLETDVAEDTIGQFTGLQDKDGKDVYEGDILRVPATTLNGDLTGIVEYEDDGFIVRSVTSGTASNLAWALRKRMDGEPVTELIGNIHDNPELLKGGEQ